jgi:UDP-3-O-[3-hydroxymyristoyl] glucosamine N-acyltransferase
MIYKFNKDIIVSNIAKKIKLKFNYFGDKKKTINNLCSIKYSNSKSLTFIENENYEQYIKKKKTGVVILKKKNSYLKNQIICNNPKLFFCKMINLLLPKKLDRSSFLKKNFRSALLSSMPRNTTISDSVFIGNNVSIGKNCYIGNNVVIYPGTRIGNNVVILDNTVLGIDGLGYIKNSLMPHIGLLVIKDNVSLGSNCTVVKGTLENTIIEKFVKIGNNVNIGHNVLIQSNTKISSSSSIAGGTIIEPFCEIALGVSIKNNITIGKKSKIGIGSVVIKNVKKNSMIFGNPGKDIIILNKIL